MTTPFDEGHTAGYCDHDRRNPYRRGVPALMAMLVPRAIAWAALWDAGYEAGQMLARDDLQQRYREACR